MNNQDKNTNDEPIDTSTFMNNNPLLVLADKFWTRVCSPVVNFVERLSENLTNNWVKQQLTTQENEERQVALEAEQYRKDREAFLRGE